MTDAAPVAMINEEAARRFWPGRDPIGSRLALDSVAGQESWLEVVGVVGNLRNSDVDQGPMPQVFVSTTRQPSADLAVVVKSVGADPLQLVPAIRAQVAAIDPNQPIHDVASMTQVLFDDLATTYVLSAILSHHWSGCDSCCRRPGSTDSCRTQWLSAAGRSACGWPSAPGPT